MNPSLRRNSHWSSCRIPSRWGRYLCLVPAAITGTQAIAVDPVTSGTLSGDHDNKGTPPIVEPARLPGFEVFRRVTPGLYSGSKPEGDEALAALARLGIRTVVSVDGERPEVEAARRHGIRYVHLPFGYDGIPLERVVELEAVVQSLPGPIFVHCHHGKHRGPAAVAVMCLAHEGWTPSRAEAWLTEAGTSREYPGLYRAVLEFRTPDAAAVALVRTFPEVATVPPVVDSMVAIDQHVDRLKAAQRSGWSSPTPGGSPASDATLLWESFRELGRHPDTAGRPEDYRRNLATAESAVDALRKALQPGDADSSPAMKDAAFQEVTRSCIVCHKVFRN